jgi:Flp pilus assembly protein TadD
LKDAEQFAQQALGINPRSPAALQLLADVHFLSGEIAESAAQLERAKAINAVDEATLGRLAACQFVTGRTAEFEALCRDVTARDPKPGRFWFELASRLDDRRLFDDAQRYFRQALEAWPQFGEAKTGLGMLAMRLGQEDEARKVLSAAFQADPFNVRIANTLKVLRHLEGYTTVTTPHFAVRFDAKTDAALGPFLADTLEQEYERLAKVFQFRPAGPILIEIFNRHDMFSGRTTGLPDLHTIGACTGRMVAMVSPKGQGMRKPFSWGRVMRHELVHIFNLEQTKFQVPHWLTEGLAVRNEGFARPADWVHLLAERAAADELLNLNTINLGFMRPRSPSEWTLAYCQAQLYVEYLTQTYGEGVVAGLLKAYGERLDTPAALQQACGADVAAVEAGYKEYVRGVVAKVKGRPPEKPLTLTELQTAVENAPGDLDLAARLAEQYWRRRRAGEARPIVERILQKAPKHGLALFVKAQLLFGSGEDEHAQQLLELASKIERPEPKVLRALGKQHFDAAKFELAEEVYLRGRQAEPAEPSWLEDLARVYKQTGDAAKRIAILEQLAPTDPDDLPMRRELAEQLAAAGRWADAERWAREALEIDVDDAASRTVLLKALEAGGKSGEAERVRKMLEEKP